MDFTEGFLKELSKMDKKQLSRLLQSASRGLSKEQQRNLQDIMEDKQKIEQLKQKVTPDDIEKVKANMSSPDEVRKFFSDPATRARLNEILKK